MHNNAMPYTSGEKVQLTRIVVNRTPKRDKKILKVVGASWFQTRVSSYIIIAMSLLGIITIIVGELGSHDVDDGNYSATVFWRQKTSFKIEFWGQGNDLEKVPSGAARAYFRPDMLSNGWSVLEIETSLGYPDWVQAYSAGLLEGSLTWQSIYWQWKNTVENACDGYEEKCKEIREFLEENEEVIRSLAIEKEFDPFWHQIRLFYAQLDGLETGWRYAVKRSRQGIDIPSSDFLWMNVMSDLNDLEKKFDLNRNETSANLPGLASAFMKLINTTENAKVLQVAHNSAGRYNSMLRILKRYEFNYHQTIDQKSAVVPGVVITFPSYPGSISSQDDFYIIKSNENSDSHNMVVTGTTINIFNSQLWTRVSSDDLILVGPRVMAANRLASGGQNWSKLLAQGDVGTGNKQWLVADLQHLISIAENGTKGLLWLVEQIPGKTNATDISNLLVDKGYWSTYGLPYFEYIYQASGAKKMESLHGSDFSYENSAKAKIFREKQDSCTSLDDILRLMRNISEEPSFFEIASRGDLHKEHGIPIGTLDTKVLLAAENSIGNMRAISGPPHSRQNFTNPITSFENITAEQNAGNKGGEIPPFQWSTSAFNHLPHLGHPDVWNFNPIDPMWVWD